MNKRWILILVLLAASSIVWFLWQRHADRNLPPSPLMAVAPRREPDPSPLKGYPSATEIAPPTSAPSAPPIGVKGLDAQSDKRYLDKIAPVFLRSLVFYGKVVDEQNKPVTGAKARFSLMNNPNPNGAGSRGEVESDQDGRFVVRGRGIGIYVEVSKEGYYRVPESDGKLGSSRGFRNHENLSSTENPMPTDDRPAIFVLHKMGGAMALVHVGPRSLIVPKNGAPTDIDLMTGQVAGEGKGQLRIEVWTQNQGMNPNKGQRYDWRCHLTIVGGGLVERMGTFDFEAPEEGYSTVAEFTQSRTDEHWRDSLVKQFFVHLADNRYARISIEVITIGDHFVVIEGFLNPEVGNRHLEFDPAKTIKLK